MSTQSEASARGGSAPARWGGVRPDDLLWEEWEGEYVLHHVPSGTTHYVNALTIAVLEALAREPGQSADALSRRLSPSPPPGAAPDPRPFITLLARLDQLGIVRRLDPV